jgi:hypothetical protein
VLCVLLGLLSEGCLEGLGFTEQRSGHVGRLGEGFGTLQRVKGRTDPQLNVLISIALWFRCSIACIVGRWKGSAPKRSPTLPKAEPRRRSMGLPRGLLTVVQQARGMRSV